MRHLRRRPYVEHLQAHPAHALKQPFPVAKHIRDHMQPQLVEQAGRQFGVGVTKSQPGSIDGLMLVVENIQALYKEWSGRGVEMTEPKLEPWGSTHSYLSDPDGNSWTIQEKPKR